MGASEWRIFPSSQWTTVSCTILKTRRGVGLAVRIVFTPYLHSSAHLRTELFDIPSFFVAHLGFSLSLCSCICITSLFRISHTSSRPHYLSMFDNQSMIAIVNPRSYDVSSLLTRPSCWERLQVEERRIVELAMRSLR